MILQKKSGTWKNITPVKVKISGVWKEVISAYIKVSGSWKLFYSNTPIIPTNGIAFFTAKPTNAYLCDGNNSTINLIGRYLLPAASESTVDAGANAHSETHSGYSSGVVNQVIYGDRSGNASYKMTPHTHTISHTHISVDKQPPFKELVPCEQCTDVILDSTARMFFAESTVPSGWEEDEDYDEKFVKGGSTSGTEGGQETHSHASQGFTTSTEDPKTNASTSFAYVIDNETHSHSYTHGHSAQPNIPPFITLKLIKPTNVAATLPSGICMFFRGSTAPTGWSYYSAAEGKFIKVSSTVGTTGGLSTHSHADAVNTSAHAEPKEPAIIDDDVRFIKYMSSHYHTAYHTHTTSNYPLYRGLLFCKKD